MVRTCHDSVEGTVGRGDANLACVEATGRLHRPQIEVGKYVEEEEAFLCNLYFKVACCMGGHSSVT